MDHQEPDPLIVRFGTPRYYEDVMKNVVHYNAKESYRQLDRAKDRKDGSYEDARQQFLSILGQHKAKWNPTSRVTDQYVEITKIYQEDKTEYVAFMRILPKGYRGERLVPEQTEMTFHLLMGRAMLVYRKRPRNMMRGSHVVIQPKTTFSIKCVGHEPALFVFRILIKTITSQPKARVSQTLRS